ncbi:MAG: nicotinate phosphoribosyltransferase [Candidatus Paceibacteria bacterium]
MNSLLMVDGYKVGHHLMYPDKIEKVYSNFTPRSNKYAPQGNNGMILNFGQQAIVRYIVDHFNENFFKNPKNEVINEIKKEMSMYLNLDYDTTHFEKLHDLGYLPLKIKSLEEGTESPIKVPILTLVNTHPEFAWLTNYLETIISNLLWQPITSATTALIYRRMATNWVNKTDKNNLILIDWMLHDFSMRGLTGLDAAIFSGMAHASVFLGSDSLPVIYGARKFYDEEGFVVGSVNASEHSIMSSGGVEGELEIYRRLIHKFPSGILSLVSDTYDLWRVITEYLPQLKDEILAREGKLVIRPDSGNPVDIICGVPMVSTSGDGVNWDDTYKDGYKKGSVQQKGVIELLWDIFGGTINDQGYKVLDPHIGMIYGESINTENYQQILARLERKGFAATNLFCGIGSYTYQMKTRDTWGIACKCTAQQVDGKLVAIFKDPITDSGLKKSAKGLLCVRKDFSGYYLNDNCTWEQENEGELKTIFEDGVFKNQTTLTKIRENIKKLL